MPLTSTLTSTLAPRLLFCGLCAAQVPALHDFERIRCANCHAPVEALLVILGPVAPGPERDS